MIFTDFLQNQNDPLSLETSLYEAIDVMEMQNLSHFPIVDNNVYLGSLPLEDIYDLDSRKSVQEVNYLWQPFFAREQSSWLELYELFAKNKSTMVPVLNNDNQYCGYYLFEDVNGQFLQMPLFKEHGITLELEHNLHKYSLSQVAQIVESNNGKLLGAFVTEMNEENIRVTLKFTSTHINDTLQTFRRYEYQIITDHSDDYLMEELKDRSNYLDKYLNL